MGHNYTQTKLIRKDISDKTLSKNSGTNKEEKDVGKPREGRDSKYQAYELKSCRIRT